jgi:hypothetical protein
MEGFTMKRIILVVAALAFIVVYAGLPRAANEINGTYIGKENRNEYITFSADGKFFLKLLKKSVGSEHSSFEAIEGTYRTDGDTVVLTLPDGGEAAGKIKDGTFMDNEHKLWIKEGAPQKMGPGIQPKKRSMY